MKMSSIISPISNFSLDGYISAVFLIIILYSILVEGFTLVKVVIFQLNFIVVNKVN